jgi:PAS domain S-box-containing protein
VSDVTAPSLDDLNTLRAPAWLWDGDRLRVVWANPAGVAFFGCSSLYDLVDIPFDEHDAGVARVRELAGQVRRGESWQEVVSFASAVSDEPFSASFHVHALADGRSGLLVVADQGLPDANAEPDVAGLKSAGIIETLPVALIVCDEDGAVRSANAAARAIWRGDVPGSLDAMMDGDDARALLIRAGRAGVAGTTARLDTGWGKRAFRLLARHLDGAQGDDGFSLVLEDITDRQALRQTTQAEAAAAGVAKVAGPVASSSGASTRPPSPDTSSSLERIRTAIEAAGLDAQDAPASNDTSSAEPAMTDAPAEHQPPASPPASTSPAASGFDVAPIVRKALSAVRKAVVLYRGGKLVYANAAAASLFGHDHEDALADRHDIASALAGIEGKSGRISVASKRDDLVELEIEKSTFPWNDGAIPLAVLRAVETGVTAPEQPVVPAPVAVEEVAEDTANEPEPEPKPAPEPVAAAAAPLVTTDERTASNPVEVDELFSILDTASDGVVFLSERGDITWMSAGAEALFGLRAASVIDTPLAELMDKASAKTVRDYVAALGDRGLSSLFNSGREVTARMQEDGGEVPLFLTMRRVSGAISGFPASAYCAVLRDITQWKKTEADLRDARDRAEAASRQKSEFLARMSHELRTPLNAILGFSDVMRKGEFGKLGNERYEGYANDIHISGEYLLSLVNDLLDLSKVEAGRLELNFTSVDLGAVIDTCMQLMQNEATAGRVVLRKSIAERLPQVVADQRSVKQVVLNLISNAIKFTDPGGQVIIAARVTSGGELLLSISDTGVGMNEDQLKEALEPFSRIETVGREAQGTGLGLPLTKALVEANRARFAISSEPRKGTRIDITFPTTRVLAG